MEPMPITHASTQDEIVVTVEIPRGSRNKYEYDAELQAKDLEGVRTHTAGFGDRSEALSVPAETRARAAGVPG
jgi:inorganic pyrophosphatase